MHVLLFSPGFAANENDHNCIPPLQSLVQELTVRNVEVHIIAMEYPFQREPYLWQGATVWPMNGQNRRWHKPITFCRACLRANWLIKRRKFDVLHSFWYGMSADIANIISKRHHIPHFTTFMGQDVLLKNAWPRWAVSTNTREKKNWVVLSKFQKKILTE